MKTANFRLENGCEVRGICRSANFRLGNEYEVREISKTANFSRNLSSGVRIFLKDDSYVPILAEEKPKNWNFFSFLIKLLRQQLKTLPMRNTNIKLKISEKLV